MFFLDFSLYRTTRELRNRFRDKFEFSGQHSNYVYADKVRTSSVLHLSNPTAKPTRSG